MGKRGPQASGGYADKTAVLSTRITGGLRLALEEAAQESGRTLSSEIEHRLRRSFDNDNVVETLGGRQLYAILRAISATMMVVGTGWLSAASNKSRQHLLWLNDPAAFDEVVQGTNAVLQTLRPKSEPSGGVWKSGVTADRVGLGIMEQIAETEPTQPSPSEKLANNERLFRRIASDLGEMHSRLPKRSISKREG